MTRKQRQSRTETYDLSNPRNVAAFEALIAAEDDGAQDRNKPPRGKRGQQLGTREKEKFFKLKADPTPPAVPQSAATVNFEETLMRLQETFAGTCEASMLADVLRGTGGDFSAAVDALLCILGTQAPAADQPSSSKSAANASSSSYSSSALGLEGTVRWQELPADVKCMILSHLPLRDLARAAHTSREFHERASTVQRRVRHLVLQPGLSYSTMVGMVRSHRAAAVVDLSRLERRSSRQQTEEVLMPQVVAMQKQEAEANLFKSVLAVCEGDAGVSRAVAVEGLVLKGLVGATDRVLAEALQGLRGLRSLDLSHCPSLTNKSLYAMAKYKRSEDGVEQQLQQEQQGQEDKEGDLEAAFEYGTTGPSHSAWQTKSGSASEGEPVDLEGLDEAISAAEEAAHNDSSSGGGGDEGLSDSAAALTAVEEEDLREDAAAAALPSSSTTEGVPSDTAAAAPGGSAGADDLGGLNPAVHDPVNVALTAAVTQRLAAVQLQAQQQAAAAAASAAAAAANPVGLEELRLCDNRGWADDGLRLLLQSPVTKHSLLKLDISRCRSLSSAGLIIPPGGALRELHACRVDGLTQLVLHLPAAHPLTSLDLSNCHYLRKVDLHLKRLQHLKLAACRTLYRLRMRCPSLKTLSLPHCGMLHELHADSWLVPALQSLNMFGCRRASGLMLQAVLDTLPDLQSLNLNGCWGISRLHLTANPLLKTIDLTGCRNLLSFSSSSTQLTELWAASCSRLHSLTLASSSMATLQLSNCAQLEEVYVRSDTSNRHGGSKQDKGARAVGLGLAVNGCSALSVDSKARLASITAAQSRALASSCC